METMRATRYEYDYSTVYLVRAYNHTGQQYQDPFGDSEDMMFTDIETAKKFVIDYRNKRGVWQESAEGWFCPVDTQHGWRIIQLALISSVRELKKVAV